MIAAARVIGRCRVSDFDAVHDAKLSADAILSVAGNVGGGVG